MKKGIQLTINFNKNFIYSLIIVSTLIFCLGLVYSYTNSLPNPGHGADTILVSVGDQEKTLQQAIDAGDLSGASGQCELILTKYFEEAFTSFKETTNIDNYNNIVYSISLNKPNYLTSGHLYIKQGINILQDNTLEIDEKTSQNSPLSGTFFLDTSSLSGNIDFEYSFSANSHPRRAYLIVWGCN